MELIRALGVLAEPPTAEHHRVSDLLGIGAPPPASDYTNLFLFHLYPYASIYLGPDGMMDGDAGDRIAGFWRALGHSPPPESDHLAALLGLLAGLCQEIDGEGDEAKRILLANARETLLIDHVLSWVPPYLRAVEEIGPPFYRRWAALLRQTLVQIAQEVALQSVTAVHLKSVGVVEDPRESGGEGFLSAVLAPARSGFILARADLARAARSLGLGFRLGERSYQLKALLSQDPGPVLGWLESEASRWVTWHAEESWAPTSSRKHWLSRSVHTRELLGSLAADGWGDVSEVAEPAGAAGTAESSPGG